VTVVVISASSSDVVDMPTTLRVARRGDNGATTELVHRASPRIECLVSLLATGAAEVQSRVVSAPPELLRTVRLRKTFASEGAPVRALRGVDLVVGAGEFVAVTGPSGCGKSTLLNLVAGVETPSDGEVFLAGEPLTGKNESELAHLRRRHVGFVFQFFNLLEDCSALENVALTAVIAGTPRRRAELRARQLLDLLGLPDKAADLPGVLSGGQRQRLAIARALANEPTLLLADEPTGALDSAGGLEVLELFRRLHVGGQAILLVTHDERVAEAAERVVRMQDGRIVGSTIAMPTVKAAGG
jgi:putative ABC transport system ATP-binding protein